LTIFTTFGGGIACVTELSGFNISITTHTLSRQTWTTSTVLGDVHVSRIGTHPIEIGWAITLAGGFIQCLKRVDVPSLALVGGQRAVATHCLFVDGVTVDELANAVCASAEGGVEDILAFQCVTVGLSLRRTSAIV
jgi:hypothetical protein